MAMSDVVSELSSGGLMVQVCQLGPWVASHLALLCIHHVNWMNSCND